MKTPITYYGGKQKLVKQLLALIPGHRLYVEAFVGGGALFFAKTPSEAEIINDTNGEIDNFYRIAKTQFEELKIKIEGTLHSRNTYKEALEIYNYPTKYDEITRAWAFWVVTNQGFSGKIGSWALSKDNKIGKTLANKREAFTMDYADRLKHTQVENADALKIIERCDDKNTFFYLDPPYFNSDCGHYKGYTEEEYIKLLKQLSRIKGKFLLSSYPSEILSNYIKKYGWHYKEIEQKVNVNHKSNKQKTEVIIYNYDTPEFIPNESITIPQPNKLKRVFIQDEPEVSIPKQIRPINQLTDEPVNQLTNICMQQLLEKSKHLIENYFMLIRNKVPP